MDSDDLRHFKRWETNLDDFLFKKLDIVLKIILALSHGQAAVERGFSLGKISLQVNMKD